MTRRNAERRAVTRRTAKRGGVVTVAAVAVLAVALPAAAYYLLSSNATTATATARVLGTPATGTPSATPGRVTFTVAPPGSGPAPAGFRVDRTAPSAVSGVCLLGASGGTCTDAAAVAGQTNSYAVYAVLGNWWSLSPGVVSIAVPAASYVLAPSTTTPTAGTPFTVTLTARSGSATDTAYTGTKVVSWAGGQTVGAFPPSYQTSVSFTNGVGTATVTLYRSGAQTLTATDSNAAGYTGSATVTVAAATPRLAFSACPATHPRNSSFTTTVTRTGTDQYGNGTGTAAVTVTLAPSSGNAKFTTATTTIANGALASPTVTFNTANTTGVTTSLTATATGYVTATCSVTTT